MTKCLLKALKAVDLQNHLELFRSLGYDSAGALAHFRNEHIKQLNLTEQEFVRLHALLDVLKEATREGKICPHYCKSNKQSTKKSKSIRARSIEAIQQRQSHVIKTNYSTSRKQSNENLKPKRSSSSIGITGRSSSTLLTNKNHANGFILQRPSSVVIQQQKPNDQTFFGPKSFLNRPAVQHVKVKSYNYGVPTNKRNRNTSSHRVHYQHESNLNHGSIFVPSSQNAADIISYAKPAEIYVYARKRPLLSSEIHFQDIISVPDNKHVTIAENKANLDCTPLLKKTEFPFDQVFGSDASNKQVFESTVLPFLSTNHRHNLTYICFGQTGSGKSHTIFGSRNTDGLLVYCTQLLLQEISLQNTLVCSFYEIYNNQVYDLSTNGKRLFVREDGEHHVNVIGITEIVLKNLDTLRCVIDDGLARRHHGKSAFNSNSSRSHAIFQILLKNNYNSVDNFKLVFIDLAGSERATDAQNNQRQTRREGAQINCSLLALKECIRSMDMTHSHAPFRQSKLTHILRDSLVGSKTRTCLMANVSPPDDCCQCSLNTLQYASRIRDISIRHRHRSMPMANIQRNYLDEEQSTVPIVREKPQRTFKPATASTPVHRLISSVDHQTYMTTNQTGVDTQKRTTIAKSPDNDWVIADDDMAISGSGDNLRIKSVLSSTREFLLNTNTNSQNPSSSFYLTRYEQQRKRTNDKEETPSSYFPPPQSDIKKSSPIQTNEIKQKNDNRNERQWTAVPAPPIPLSARLSDSSTEPPSSTRIIPIAPIQISDDNQYSSTTGTESLGTKITKLATGVHPYKKFTKNKNLMENLNLNKQYDTAATITTTTDTDQGLYSDRQATHRDQTGFFSNRDDPLYENDLKSSRLTTITQQITPKMNSFHHRSDVITASSYSNKSQNSFSSPTKAHHRDRRINSSSSSSTGSGKNPSPSPHRRIVPFRVHPNSDSEEIEHKPYSTRHESSQTRNQIPTMKNEQEQTDDQFLLEQFSDQTSNNFMQAPLDQVKRLYHQTLSTPISKSALPMTILFDKYPNRNGIIPLSNQLNVSTNKHAMDFRRRRTDLTPVISSHPPFDENIYLSPSKDYGVRAFDQLHTLRTLLETRLTEDDEIKHQTKDLSILQSSPQTFAKEFLQSYQQSKYKNHSTELISDLDDDDDDQQIERNLNYKDKYQSDTLSTSSNELNQAKVNSTGTLSSTSTITSNLPANINSNEPRIVSSSTNGIYSSNKTHLASISNSDAIGSTSNRTSDSERTSEVNSGSQNRYTGTSSNGSSTIGSHVLLPSLNTFDGINDGHDHLIDSGKGSSLLTGTSFDVLMNSLKSMREKDLDWIIHHNDDSLIGMID